MIINTMHEGPVTEPGAYLLDSDSYYADPAPVPSLTQSVAKVLLDKSPAHARLEHPRLTPDREDSSKRNQELGTAAHRLLIGRGKDLQVIDAPTYQSKAAKEARDEALTAGRCPVLASDHATAQAMVAAARVQLGQMAGCEEAFAGLGYGELALVWREEDLWLRCQIDWLSRASLISWDYKTVGQSAAPHVLASRIPEKGLEIQAAMHERGLGALDPDSLGRWRFRYVLQEVDEPYALTVMEMDGAAMTMGRKKLARAVDLWRQCTRADFWPGYPQAIVRPEYPSWAEYQWTSREMADAEIAGTPLDPFFAELGRIAPSRVTTDARVLGA